jgi:O-antigen ligase
VGIGNWVFHYPGRMADIPTTYIYAREQTSETGFQRAAGINHLFLRLLCETGAIGLVVFLLFLLSIGKTAVRLAWSHAGLRPPGVALAAACAALVLHFHSMSAFDKRYWWFLFGLVAAAGRVFLERSRVFVVLAPRRSARPELERVAS